MNTAKPPNESAASATTPARIDKQVHVAQSTSSAATTTLHPWTQDELYHLISWMATRCPTEAYPTSVNFRQYCDMYGIKPPCQRSDADILRQCKEVKDHLPKGKESKTKSVASDDSSSNQGASTSTSKDQRTEEGGPTMLSNSSNAHNKAIEDEQAAHAAQQGHEEQSAVAQQAEDAQVNTQAELHQQQQKQVKKARASKRRSSRRKSFKSGSTQLVIRGSFQSLRVKKSPQGFNSITCEGEGTLRLSF